MEAYQQRVLTERNDLDSKIRKLNVFLASPKSLEIDDDERSLLLEQLSYMKEYRRVLDLRINKF